MCVFLMLSDKKHSPRQKLEDICALISCWIGMQPYSVLSNFLLSMMLKRCIMRFHFIFITFAVPLCAFVDYAGCVEKSRTYSDQAHMKPSNVENDISCYWYSVTWQLGLAQLFAICILVLSDLLRKGLVGVNLWLPSTWPFMLIFILNTCTLRQAINARLLGCWKLRVWGS